MTRPIIEIRDVINAIDAAEQRANLGERFMCVTFTVAPPERFAHMPSLAKEHMPLFVGVSARATQEQLEESAEWPQLDLVFRFTRNEGDVDRSRTGRGLLELAYERAYWAMPEQPALLTHRGGDDQGGRVFTNARNAILEREERAEAERLLAAVGITPAVVDGTPLALDGVVTLTTRMIPQLPYRPVLHICWNRSEWDGTARMLRGVLESADEIRDVAHLFELLNKTGSVTHYNEYGQPTAMPTRA